MFYESIPHVVTPVADAAEAATKIKQRIARSTEALCWQNTNGKFCVVSDSHIDDSPFAETAVLQEINSEFFQIESITAAWIDTEKELAEYFEAAMSETAIKRKTQLIVGKPANQTAVFTCGCCGSRFRGNVKEQLEFDQDQGYGICPNCEHYYK
jgi:hypothetical protein